MAQQEVAQQASSIHPAGWGAIGAAIFSTSRIAVAFIKAKVAPPKRDYVREALARLEATVATKEDLKAVSERVEKVDGKVDAHVQFHLNHPAA